MDFYCALNLINTLAWCIISSCKYFFHLYIKKHTQKHTSLSFLYAITTDNSAVSIILEHFRWSVLSPGHHLCSSLSDVLKTHYNIYMSVLCLFVFFDFSCLALFQSDIFHLSFTLQNLYSIFFNFWFSLIVFLFCCILAEVISLVFLSTYLLIL